MKGLSSFPQPLASYHVVRGLCGLCGLCGHRENQCSPAKPCLARSPYSPFEFAAPGISPLAMDPAAPPLITGFWLLATPGIAGPCGARSPYSPFSPYSPYQFAPSQLLAPIVCRHCRQVATCNIFVTFFKKNNLSTTCIIQITQLYCFMKRIFCIFL